MGTGRRCRLRLCAVSPGWHVRHHAAPDGGAPFGPEINAVVRGERPVGSAMEEPDQQTQPKLIGAYFPCEATKIPRSGGQRRRAPAIARPTSGGQAAAERRFVGLRCQTW